MLVEVGTNLAINPNEIVTIKVLSDKEGYRTEITLKSPNTFSSPYIVHTSLRYEDLCEVLAVAKIPNEILERYKNDEN